MANETQKDASGSPPFRRVPESVADFEFQEHVRYEVSRQTDRGAAILAGTLVDDSLKIYLKSRMLIVRDKDVPKGGRKRDTESLFDFENVLGTFSARIRVALAMRVITDRVFFDLDDIREIRNRFAHWLKPKGTLEDLTFQSQAIAVRCNRLTYPQCHPPPISDKYHKALVDGTLEPDEFRAKIEEHRRRGEEFAEPLADPRERFVQTCCGLSRIMLACQGHRQGYTLDYIDLPALTRTIAEKDHRKKQT